MAEVEIICIGNIVADCVSRVVSKMPEKGRAVYVQSVGLYGGGSAPNAGYALAKFGFQVAVVGRVGTDAFGDFLIEEAVRHGCNPQYIIRDSSAGSAAAQVIVDSDGERSFIAALGATANFVPDDVPLETLKARGGKVLHSAGFFATTGMEGSDGTPLAGLFERASELGMLTSLDCAWDDSGRWAQLIGKVLKHTDIFCPSISEARGITGLSEPREIATKLFELGVRKLVALKMGAEGSFVASSTGETYFVPALEVKAVDGTGAGDAFIAGFLAAHLRGMGLLEAAKLGNAAGAVCVQALGATGGMASWDEVFRLSRMMTPSEI